LLLVRHDAVATEGIDWPPRSHLTAFLSEDDGQTWKGGLLLDDRVGVSYPDGTQMPDQTIHIIYDFGRMTDREILLATFTEADVLSGKWRSRQARPRHLVNKAGK
jgi:predicted neuraminidase